MNNKVDLKIFAKVNLSLNIVGIEIDKHLLDSVVASVNIFDFISVALRKDDNINITINDDSIPKNNNSITKAVEAVKRRIGSFGADIIVEKNIPIAAGLGGSSADSAGVIIALDRLLQLTARGIDIKQIAAETGSDTVYMLEGGYARISGTGNVVEKIDSDAMLNLVIAGPDSGCSTSMVYRKFDILYPHAEFSPADNGNLIDILTFNKDKNTDMIGFIDVCGSEGVSSENLIKLSQCIGNALYEPAALLCPEINDLYLEFFSLNAKAVCMSGSGSFVFGLYAETKEAKAAAEKLKDRGYYAVDAMTLKNGFEIIS